MRYTKKMVEAKFLTLARLVGWRVDAKMNTLQWSGNRFLTTYSPGDGCTRYRICEGDGDSGERELYGPWLGAAEACVALEAMTRLVCELHSNPK